MLYYGVMTAFHDDGKIYAAMVEPKEAARKPKNSFKSLPFRDVYIDYFKSKKEALEFLEEVKKA